MGRASVKLASTLAVWTDKSLSSSVCLLFFRGTSMNPRHRRVVVAILAGIVMVAVAAAMQKKDAPEASFRIVLGLKDQTPADWSGSVTVAGGEVTSLTGWRFEEKDTVEGTTGWKCKTRNAPAPGARFGTTPAGGKEPPAK